MPNQDLHTNLDRLLGNIERLSEIGKTTSGVTRLALSDEDRRARDLIVSWMEPLGLTVKIDKIGNILGIREGLQDLSPIMTGSHIDSVVGAGKLDGCYGVLAALEAIEILNNHNITTKRPLVVAVFSNEEGVRFQPDMMGSLVYAGGLGLKEAYESADRDGLTVKEELERIGYLGDMECGAIIPYAFVELHIEQGPILHDERLDIGVVNRLQGIAWKEIKILGQANHAGTTPMARRRDAGHVGAEVIRFVRSLCRTMGGNQLSTVGSFDMFPNVINVVPKSVEMTVDMRNTDESQLEKSELELDKFLTELRVRENVEIFSRTLARFKPVLFDPGICKAIAKAADDLGLHYKYMTSGAGHDAQMISRISPAAMIFVPSRDGISHNAAEWTDPEQLGYGSNALLNTIVSLAMN